MNFEVGDLQERMENQIESTDFAIEMDEFCDRLDVLENSHRTLDEKLEKYNQTLNDRLDQLTASISELHKAISPQSLTYLNKKDEGSQ